MSDDVRAREHLSAEIIEQIAIGADLDEAALAHVSSCDACAEALQKDARLELALGELHAFVAGTRHVAPPSKLRALAAPAVVLALAAAVFLYLQNRGPAPSHEVRADPSVLVAPATPAASEAPAGDPEHVIAKLRPRLKKCFTDAVASGEADGGVVLVAAIAPDGSVEDVAATEREGLGDGTVACLVTVMKSARFAASGKATSLRVPLHFVKR